MVNDSHDVPHDARTGTVQSIVSSRTIGLLVLGSSAWITLCLAVWLVPPVFLGASFALMTVGWVVMGPFLGFIAAGVVVLALRLAERVLVPVIAVVMAALAGWAVVLGIWWLLGFRDSPGINVAMAVAAVGAVISAVISWPRRTTRRRASALSLDSTSGDGRTSEVNE